MYSPKIRTHRIAALLAACLGLFTAGCGHPTVVVTARNSPPDLTHSDAKTPGITKIDGIPFYAKHGMCKRETVWAEPKDTLQLQVLQNDKAIETRTITFSRSFLLSHTGAGDTELLDLLNDLNVLTSATQAAQLREPYCPSQIAAQWERVAAEAREEEKKLSCDSKPTNCEDLATGETNGDLLRLSNTANIVVEVDYDHPYYINSRTPWIGNASVDAKLNADGSLSEGNVQATDQTWSTILTTVSSLAGSFATYAASAVTAAGTVEAAKVAAAAPPAGAVQPDMLIERVLTPPCESVPGWPLPGTIAQPSATAPPKPAAEGNDKDKTKPAPKEPPAPPVIAYRVTPSSVVYLHDHVKEEGPDGARSLVEFCQPESRGVTDGNVTISKEDAAAPDDPNVIKVSGQVKLPKSAAAK
jgi:hypothetical protein